MTPVSVSSGTGDRHDFVAALVIVAALVLTVVGHSVVRRVVRHPSAERCATMFDRYAEQQARAYSRGPPSPAVPHSLDAPDVLRCTQDLVDAEVECALKSGSVDELERCIL